MKIRLDTNYKVFNNVVKCFMKCTLTNCDEIGYIPNFRGFPFIIEALPNGDVIQSFTVTALSKCDPRDKFDPEVGKRMAESRATIKVLKIVNGLIQEERRRLSKSEAMLTTDHIKAGKLLLKEEFHLHTLLDNE